MQFCLLHYNKKILRLAADMKKIGINFQVFSFHPALHAVVKIFSLAFIFLNRNRHSSLPGIYNHLIIKNGVFSIQLPK